MPAESEFGLFKTLQDYCHATFKEISTHIINKLLMDIRLSRLKYEHFKKGLAALKQILRVLWYLPDDAVVAQAFSTAEALIKEIQEEYRSKMGIFKDEAHIESQSAEMIRRFIMSKHVLANGPEDMRSKVILTWDAACSQAKGAWEVYKSMEREIENCYKETKEEVQKPAIVEERVIQNLSWNYTERDIQQLVSVAWQLRQVHRVGFSYLFDNDSPQSRQLGKANGRIQKLMAEMNSLCKKVDDERKAKTNTNLKQLQKDKKSETHVKYEVYVKVDDAKFRSDVCILNGQQPLFCAAKTRPFEPPVGMRETGNSKWTPPTLEAQLGTTSDPQSITLKVLNASSSHIHGSFSEKDIIIKLPQKNSPFSRTTVEISGTFGSNAGKHTAKITCTRKGTEKCIGYACKEPSPTHWIDSGTNRS